MLEWRGGEKRTTRYRKVLRCRTCSRSCRVLSRERDRKLSLGEDTTLTIRARAKQLSPSPPLRVFLLDVLMEYVEKMQSAHGMITETSRFFDPAERSLPLKRKIFLYLHRTISRLKDSLQILWQKKFGYIAVLNDCR